MSHSAMGAASAAAMRAQLVAIVFAASFNVGASANDVAVLRAEFRASGAGLWDVSVTLRHDDTGWEHYADAWRVVGPHGSVLGKRVLFHPHETEQPFTRSLAGVAIDASISKVFIEAHDKVHGWADQRLEVDLSQVSDGRLVVEP